MVLATLCFRYGNASYWLRCALTPICGQRGEVDTIGGLLSFGYVFSHLAAEKFIPDGEGFFALGVGFSVSLAGCFRWAGGYQNKSA
jgi:hypothetical protein